MGEPFLIALREALQSAVLLSLVLLFQPIGTDRTYVRGLLAGFFAAFLAGFAAGYFPFLEKSLPASEIWTFWRLVSESAVFYSCFIVMLVRRDPPPSCIPAGIFLLGFLLVFFEARATGFIIHDLGAMTGRLPAAAASAAGGMILGLAPALAARRYAGRQALQGLFTLPILLMLLGALQFIWGGVGELENENILIVLQRSIGNFLNDGIAYLQSALLLQDHAFLKVSGSGLARYLAGDRPALTLTVIFLLAPPLFILIRLFGRPDPQVSATTVASQKRRKIAFFRQELVHQTIPVMTALTLLVVLLHAANVSMNPMYDPVPVPVREEAPGEPLKIRISGKTGDLNDKKLRKYVYYHGNKQVLFLAIVKPDGSVGLALDECEICRPADWNKDAKGYAQRGEHLVCKYCMTPIPTATVNKPGGCNPIPLPFRLVDNVILISRGDLVSIFEKVQTLEKKGTHL